MVGEGDDDLILLISFEAAFLDGSGPGTGVPSSVIEWFKKLGSPSISLEEVLNYKDKLVRNEILQKIAKVSDIVVLVSLFFLYPLLLCCFYWM